MQIRDIINSTEEVKIPSVNAREVDLLEELENRKIFVPYPGQFSLGEVGIWLSMFDCWEWALENDETLITLEDDAKPQWFFDEAVDLFIKELPRDWDFLCLWVPNDQKQDYLYNVTYNSDGMPKIFGRMSAKNSLFDYGAQYTAKAYNGYGNVATVFSPKGAKFFIDQARKVGLYTPVDCYLYQEAHAGRCKGFSPKPEHATLVDYDWSVPTTVHTTERFIEVYK